MDIDLNKVSFLRRDHAYNFAKVDAVYEEITRRNHVYESSNGQVFDKTCEIDAIGSSGPDMITGGNSGEEVLHAGLPSTSSRGPFNFVCTVPYSSEEAFDHSVEKICAMRMQREGEGEGEDKGEDAPLPLSGVHHHPPPPPPALNPPPHNSCAPHEHHRSHASHESHQVAAHDLLPGSVRSRDSVSTTTYSQDSQQCDRGQQHPPHRQHSHRVTKAEIPSTVRAALTASIAQQREEGGGGVRESLESEQQRRLTEFTLWRHQLMRSRKQEA